MTYRESGAFGPSPHISPSPQSSKDIFNLDSIIVKGEEGGDSSGMVGRALYFRQHVYVQSLVLELGTNNASLNKSLHISIISSFIDETISPKRDSVRCAKVASACLTL